MVNMKGKNIMKRKIVFYQGEKVVKTLNYTCNSDTPKQESDHQCLKFARQNKPASYDYYEII